MNRGNIEVMNVDVTRDLEEYLDEMCFDYDIVDVWGKSYAKVDCPLGSYRDLSRFKYGWLSSHHNVWLDICNISDGPNGSSFCVSVIQNWSDLDDYAKRYIFEMNG